MIWGVLGLAVGAAGAWLYRLALGRRGLTPLRVHTNHEPDFTLDLMRRAQRASMACLVAADGEPGVVGEGQAEVASVERTIATARLAMNDERRHVTRVEGWGCIVAVGAGGIGAALVLDAVMAGRDTVDDAVVDLSLFVRSVKRAAPADVTAATPGPPGFSPFSDSLSGVAYGMCERARSISGHACIVVARDQQSNRITVVAHSAGADRRMLGMAASEGSLVTRACFSEQPLSASRSDDLFGTPVDDRRQDTEAGFAIPIRDATRGVGGLIVFRAPELMPESVRANLVQLVSDVAPAFAAAAALKAAEDRAETDPLTGLPNRVALERAIGSNPATCALIAVDLDHFKRLNDNLGHAAGDGALQHVAGVFTQTLRDRDLPARVGGEEFALWLPGADLEVAMEIAERVRRALDESSWEWAGEEISMTCSIGVAAVPDCTSEVANLMTLADGALYRAKEGGRNRVVASAASASGRVPGTSAPS